MMRQVLPVYVADHMHHFGNVHIGTPFINDGQRCAHLLCKVAGPLHAAGVGRDHDEIGQCQRTEMTHQHRARDK